MRGLSADAIRENRARYGANALTRPAPPSFLRRLFGALAEPMMLLLLVAALITVGVNVLRALTDIGGKVDLFECVGIFAAIALSVAITLVMEGRSARAFEALRRLAGNIRVRVIRDGVPAVIPAEELVVGDVVALAAGDRVPADGRLIAQDALLVDESSLTGESEAVAKNAAAVLVDPGTPVAERRNMVYSGSFVTGGAGRFVVTAVGDETEFGRIAGELARHPDGVTPLQEKLRVLGRRISLFGAVAAAAAFVVYLIGARVGGISLGEAANAFVLSIVLVVAAVPEGLPTIAAIALSITVVRLARERALVRKMVACETVGCVDVICSDKTGTLTENRMTVTATVGPDGREVPPAGALLANCCLNATADVVFGPDGRPSFVGNPTECALLVAAHGAGTDYRALRAAARILRVEPFSSETKTMLTEAAADGGGTVVYLKGSPEQVLARCALPADRRAAVDARLAEFQSRACRVLAFAHGPSVDRLSYDGFAAIADPLRAGVREAIAQCRAAGIGLKILTGDNLITASAIARSLGVLDGPGAAVEARELESLDDGAFVRRLASVRVIARSTPLVKLRVVRALRAEGHVVAVTGDGINDAPAVRSADVGIAMGIAGTEVTREASDIVLLDDSFATLVKAVQWGRGLYENFRRFIQFQLVVNVSAVSVVLVSVLLGALGIPGNWGEPFTALELLWINVVMDGPPALTLGLEPVRGGLMARAPVRRGESIVSRDMAVRIAVSGALIALLALLQLGFNFLGAAAQAQARSAFFTLFVVCQLVNAFNCRALGGEGVLSHFFANRAMLAAFGCVFVLQVLITQFGHAFFGTVALPAVLWLKIVVAAVAVAAASECVRRAFRIRPRR